MNTFCAVQTLPGTFSWCFDVMMFYFEFSEAHLLPLILSRKGQTNVSLSSGEKVVDTAECPNSEHFRNAEKIRLPLKNLVEGTCPSQPVKYVVTLFPTEIRSIQFNRYRCFVYLLIILLMQNSLRGIT